jgi:hypothetical protein
MILFCPYTYFGVSKHHLQGVVEFTSIDRTIMNASLHPYKMWYIKWQSNFIQYCEIIIILLKSVKFVKIITWLKIYLNNWQTGLAFRRVYHLIWRIVIICVYCVRCVVSVSCGGCVVSQTLRHKQSLFTCFTTWYCKLSLFMQIFDINLS